MDPALIMAAVFLASATAELANLRQSRIGAA
jgi:hypothetical protein